MTPAQLQAAGINAAIAQAWADPLSAACAINDISTPQRQAAFLAQLAVETAYFRELDEDLDYRNADRIFELFRGEIPDHETAARLCHNPEALANMVYANRNGNGGRASGDGWRYRGRGPIQLTGRDNYRACGAAIAVDLVDDPDLLATPGPGCLGAAWFWARNGLTRSP